MLATIEPAELSEWELHELAVYESERSLTAYLGHVQIDARPEPSAWRGLIEPWQGDIVSPMIPALEYAAGLRTDYAGPGIFVYVLPRGHDKTGLIGRLANWCLAFARKPLSIAVAASTKDQARLLAKSMDAEIRLNPWLAKRISPYRNELRGPGGTLEVLSADAAYQSGRKDDVVIIDEWTFWEDRDLFDMLISGSAKRPGSVFIIITNAGMRNAWQHRELIKAQADPAWHIYQSPAGQQLASWMDESAVERIRRIIRPSFARRVIGNEWIDATETPLLSEELIRSCVGDCLHKGKDQRKGRFVMGGDYGRTSGRTVSAILEATGEKKQVSYTDAKTRERRTKSVEVLAVRCLDVLHNTKFRDQEKRQRELIDRYGVVKAHLDKGAQGWTTVENLEDAYPRVCVGHHLNETFQAEIGLALLKRFEDQTLIIPDDPDLIADLQLVDEADTVNGKPKIRSRSEKEIGHADRFWALALAVHAAESTPKTQDFVTRVYRA
jgi:hypothetical protein